MVESPADADDARTRHRWLVVGVLVLSTALSFVDRQVLAALAPTPQRAVRSLELRLRLDCLGVLALLCGLRAGGRPAHRPRRPERGYLRGRDALVRGGSGDRVRGWPRKPADLPRRARRCRIGWHPGHGEGLRALSQAPRAGDGDRAQSGGDHDRHDGGAAAGRLAGHRLRMEGGVRRHRRRRPCVDPAVAADRRGGFPRRQRRAAGPVRRRSRGTGDCGRWRRPTS